MDQPRVIGHVVSVSGFRLKVELAADSRSSSRATPDGVQRAVAINSFLTFDLVKFGNRYIKKYIPELLILRWQKEFYTNLLEPPSSVNLDEWMMTFCEIFSEAYELIGLDEKKFYGKGAGIEHILFQHLISENLKDLSPKIELYRGEKHIDVAFEYQDKLYAIEIELTPNHIKENITKDIENAKCDFVIVACKDDKVLRKAKSIIDDLPKSLKTKTHVLKISELLKKSDDEIIKKIHR